MGSQAGCASLEHPSLPHSMSTVAPIPIPNTVAVSMKIRHKHQNYKHLYHKGQEHLLPSSAGSVFLNIAAQQNENGKFLF